MSTAIPMLNFLNIHQPNVSLMHQRSRLKCLVGCFLVHLLRRRLAQLFVYQRQQLLRGAGIALLDFGEDAGNRSWACPIRNAS